MDTSTHPFYIVKNKLVRIRNNLKYNCFGKNIVKRDRRITPFQAKATMSSPFKKLHYCQLYNYTLKVYMNTKLVFGSLFTIYSSRWNPGTRNVFENLF